MSRLETEGLRQHIAPWLAEVVLGSSLCRVLACPVFGPAGEAAAACAKVLVNGGTMVTYGAMSQQVGVSGSGLWLGLAGSSRAMSQQVRAAVDMGGRARCWGGGRTCRAAAVPPAADHGSSQPATLSHALLILVHSYHF